LQELVAPADSFSKVVAEPVMLIMERRAAAVLAALGVSMVLAFSSDVFDRVAEQQADLNAPGSATERGANEVVVGAGRTRTPVRP